MRVAIQRCKSKVFGIWGTIESTYGLGHRYFRVRVDPSLNHFTTFVSIAENEAVVTEQCPKCERWKSPKNFVSDYICRRCRGQ